MSKPVLPKLSEKEEKELAAHFDGELSPKAHEKVSRRLNEGDESLQLEMESLQFVREELKEWFSEEMNDANGVRREIDVWQQVEQRISSKPAKAKEGFGFFAGLKELIFPSEGWMSVPSFAAGACVMLLTLYLGGNLSSPGISPQGSGSGDVPGIQPAAQLASSATADLNSFRQGNSAQEQSRPGRLLERARFDSRSFDSELFQKPSVEGNRFAVEQGPAEVPVDSNLVVPVSRGGVLSARGSRPLKLRVRPQILQVLGTSSLGQGMRAGGVDIDWIKSGKPYTYKIVPAKDRFAPPVIWVARR